MNPSRMETRSLMKSRYQKTLHTEQKFITSGQYLEICMSKQQKSNQVIFDSLYNYQKQINILKASLLLCQFQQNILRKKIILSKINGNNRHEIKKQSAIIKLNDTIGLKLLQKKNLCLIKIKQKANPPKSSPTLIKNILNGSFNILINKRIRQLKQQSFKQMLRVAGMGSVVERYNIHMIAKGNALLALKQYPQNQLKRSFWRWYLTTTSKADSLFLNCSDKLVLYTNVNKHTFFYRLLNSVRKRFAKVDPKTKRMTVMFYLYTKIYFQRQMRQFFQKIKIIAKSKDPSNSLAQNLVQYAQLRQKDVFRQFSEIVKKHRQNKQLKKQKVQRFAKKMIEVSNDKRKLFLSDWNNLSVKNQDKKLVKQGYIRKLILTKTGKIIQLFKLWYNLPVRSNKNKFDKLQKFHKGLIKFTTNTLTKVFNSFKNQIIVCQVLKKQAVIKLVQSTQGKQRKYYQFWIAETKKLKIMKQCKQMATFFQSLNILIKQPLNLIFKKQINEIRKKYMNRFLSTKIGRIFEAFQKIKTLPERKNNLNLIKASQFEKHLFSFVRRTLKRSFQPFISEYLKGEALKKKCLIQIIECSSSLQKRYFNRWLSLNNQENMKTRYNLMELLFKSCNKAIHRNFQPFFIQKQFSLVAVQTLHRFFSTISCNTNLYFKSVIYDLKKNSYQKKKNRWHKKAAQHLALRTQINMQKSFWRLLDNIEKQRICLDQGAVKKLKKMYNHIHKYYELVLFKAFFLIESHARASVKSLPINSRKTSIIIRSEGFNQQDSLIQQFQISDMGNIKDSLVVESDRKRAIILVENFFNQNLKTQISRWKYNAIPQKRLSQYRNQLKQSHPQFFNFLSFIQGARILQLIIGKIGARLLSQNFRAIYQSKVSTKVSEPTSISLIKRQSLLLQQNHQYKRRSQSLLSQLQNKQTYLKQANQAVTLLSLRINYMITQKFVQQVEKVVEKSIWRALNQGFDGIMERANQNYQNIQENSHQNSSQSN